MWDKMYIESSIVSTKFSFLEKENQLGHLMPSFEFVNWFGSISMEGFFCVLYYVAYCLVLAEYSFVICCTNFKCHIYTPLISAKKDLIWLLYTQVCAFQEMRPCWLFFYLVLVHSITSLIQNAGVI